jgi:hypothetical protein
MEGRRKKLAYVQRLEKADSERHKAQIHQDNIGIIASIDTLAWQIKTTRDDENARERKNNFREWAGIVGIYLAAFVAIWAIGSAGTDSERQRVIAQDTEQRQLIPILTLIDRCRPSRGVRST